jgi:integrase
VAVREPFKRITDKAGLGRDWTPRELRTSFASILSSNDMAIEEISRLMGHSSTKTTETVYRKELRPVITTGAEVMDQIFSGK